MTDKLTDADLDELLRAADPLRHEPPPSRTETEGALRRLLQAGPAAAPSRADSYVPSARALVPDSRSWLAVVRGHASDRGSKRRRSPVQKWRRRLAGTIIGVAAAATALALVLGASTTSPAFAVTRHHDGTVTISIKRQDGIGGANARLHQLGIRATVRQQAPAGCHPSVRISMSGKGAPASSRTISKAQWTIDPRKVPKDHTLALTPPPPSPPPAGNAGHSGSTGTDGQTWSCPAVSHPNVHEPAPGAGDSGPPPSPSTSGNRQPNRRSAG